MPRAFAIALPGLALLLLSAHFFRAGWYFPAAASFALIALLFVSRPWAARVLRALLLLGALEWLRTAWVLTTHRVAAGQPYVRMLVILGAVAAVTVLAALLAGRIGTAPESSQRSV
jgi:hypothetical protein